MEKISVVLFFLGMSLSLIYAAWSGLFSFGGHSIQKRNRHSLFLALLCNLTLLGLIAPNFDVLFKSIILSVPLSLVWIFFSYKWFSKRIDGNKFLLPKKSVSMRYVYSFLSVSSVMIFMETSLGDSLRQLQWPLFGFLFSFLISSIFTYIYIVKIEAKIGSPIVEAIGDKNT